MSTPTSTIPTSTTDPNSTTSTVMAASGAMNSLMGAMSTMKEKFDAAGGNDMVSRVSSSIPQGAKDYIGNASQKIFNRDHLRSLTVFFGIGEERPFYVEKSPSLLMARVQHNGAFFYLNYMLVFAILFVITMLTSITTMIGLGLLAGAWLYIVRATSEGQMKIGALTVTQKQATIVMSVISAIVLFYLLSNVFWWTAGSGGFMITIHALLRDASMHQDQEDKVEMSGNLTIEENASFLNPVEGQEGV